MHRILVAFAVAACLSIVPAFAQGTRFTGNFGIGMGFNQGRTANLANTSGNIVVGVGYNISEVVSATAEYQYYNLENKSTEAQTEALEQDVGQVDSITANLLFKIPSKWGMYGIGGVGWYRRYVRITGPSLVPPFVGDPAVGFNIGTGVTFPFEDRFKLYLEVRYHHAYNHVIPMQMLPLTFGVRW